MISADSMDSLVVGPAEKAAVYSGGSANNAIVSSGGSIVVSEGGTANGATVNGALNVRSGGTAHDATASNGGKITVYQGAAADRLVIFGGGVIALSSGAIANRVALNSGGDLELRGGTATVLFSPFGSGNIHQYLNAEFVGGTYTQLERDANVYFGNSVSGTVSSANSMSGLVISSGYSTFVYQDGNLDGAKVSRLGRITVSSGGTVNSATVNSGGSLIVSSGGTATIAFDPWQGIIQSNEGAAVSYLDPNAGVYYGNSSGLISSADVMEGITLARNYSAIVYSGGQMNGITINSGGSLIVSSGGTATIAFDPWRGIIQSNEGATVSYLERDAGVYYGNSAGLVSRADVMDSLTVEQYFSAIVYSGGQLNRATVNQGGRLIISGGGTATIATVDDGGSFTVLDGGTATGTIVNGTLDVRSGGMATGGSVDSYGCLVISGGGTVNGTVIGNDGAIIISSGGTATDLTVSSGALLAFCLASDTCLQGTLGGRTLDLNGAFLSGFTVDYGVCLTICSGGTATGLIENGGNVDIEDGAHVTFAENTFSGMNLSGYSASIHSGTTAVDIDINGGILDIHSGGSAEGINVREGYLSVDGGGSADGIDISNGHLYVASGGTATNVVWTPILGKVTVADGGFISYAPEQDTISGVYYRDNSSSLFHVETVESKTFARVSMFVMSGGTANAITANGGSITVSSAGTVNDLSLWSGYLDVRSDGMVTNAAVWSGTRMTVSSGGVAIRADINFGGSLDVRSGGLVQYACINDSARMTVSDGGIAISAAVAGYNASMTVNSGGTALVATVSDSGNVNIFGMVMAATIDSGGNMTIRGDALASGALVNSSGRLIVSGSADYVTVSGGNMNVYGLAENTLVTGISPEQMGFLSVSAGGSLVSTTVGRDGKLNVRSGSATGTTVSSGGQMSVSTGKTDRTVIDSGGKLNVFGGMADNTSVCGNGVVEVNGGTAFRTTVSSGAGVILNGGLTDSTTILSGGSMIVTGGSMGYTLLRGGEIHISSGGKLNGRLARQGGVVSVFEGGTVDFDLTRTMPGNTVRINGLSSIRGTPVYTITVNPENLAEGLYLLADGATGFDQSISVRSRDGITLGMLSVGETITVSETDYTLNLSDGYLSLQVGDVPATSSNVSGGLVLWDRKDVRYGEVFSETLILSGGTMNVSSGGIAESTTVAEVGGFLKVSSGGTANVAILSSGARLEVSSGGIANSVTVRDLGLLSVNSGGSVYSATVMDGGDMRLVDGAMANKVRVESNGQLIVSHGGSADNITLRDGAELYLLGGSATNLNIASGAIVTVALVWDTCLTGISAGKPLEIRDGTASDISIESGFYFVYSGGIANHVSVDQGGSMVVQNGSATGIVENGGYVRVVENRWTSSYAAFTPNTFSGLSLGYGQSATVHSGTVADSITVASGGGLVLYSGGKLTGQVVFESGSFISAAGNAIIDFDISGIAPGAQARINDLSLVQKSRKDYDPLLYTLTVSDSQQDGVYILAEGVMSAITLSVRNTAGSSLGTFSSGSITRNGTVYTLSRSGDVLSLTVTSLDTIVPAVLNVQADIEGPTNRDVTVTAAFADDVELAGAFYRIGEDGDWFSYENGVTVSENTTVYFKAVDAAGNESEIVGYDVANIDRTAPAPPEVSADIEGATNQAVFVSAVFEDDAAVRQYSLDGKEWVAYAEAVKFEENGSVFFRCADTAGNFSEVVSCTVGNIDKTAPSAPLKLQAVVSGQSAALIWSNSTDDLSGVREYVVRYSLDGQEFTETVSDPNLVLNTLGVGSWNWSVQAVDFAGNESAVTVGEAFSVSGFSPYTVEYSADDFEHVIRFTVTTPALDYFRMPTGTYRMRVRQEGSSEWMTGDSIVAAEFDSTPQVINSDADGNADVFFANSVGTWESCYFAQHVGSVDDWAGTTELASLYGKNKLADIIEGSTDANILLMTDDDNGDTLFVEDIYTASPGNIAEKQARIARIDEIRAGAGNDIVDMTSQQFEYIGDGLTIRGGDGNDTIWANKGDNRLFGDAGNDRIVGASGSDVIAGGIGNDRMHGGGGSDVFTFCENWGTDTVEQLAAGSVTLWFAESESQITASELDGNSVFTNAAGTASVTVKGFALADIAVRYGDDGSAQFVSLANMGAFFDATTERIFEESGKGVLACL